MKTNDFEDGCLSGLKHEKPILLTLAFSSTGAGAAWVSGNYIVINITTKIALNTYINLSTPFNFDVVDMWSIKGDGTANATLQVKNTTTEVSDAVALTTADKTIDRATTMNDAANSFAVGENDLRVYVGTAAFLGKIIIEIDR